jgi:integrase
MAPRTKKKVLYLHERDGVLYVRVPYCNSAGVRRSKEKRVENEREAIKIISEIRHQLGEAGPGVFDGERMTFDELLAEYRRAHPDKHRWYLDPIEKYFGQRRIRTITYGDLKRFKTEREGIKKPNGEKRKPATIHRELEQLRSVLLLAVRHGWLLRNPFMAGPPLIIKSEEERRDRIPTPEEEEKILAVCVPPYRAHLRPLVIASLDTGLRRSALQSLTWSAVDFENHVLKIPRGNRYKNRPKLIGMTTRLEAELQDLFERSDKNPETGIFRKVKDFKRSWKTACRLAGVEGLRFNDLRHGFSTGLMEAGIPRDLAMKAAGHSNPDIHEIYTNIDHRIARQLAEALNKLHETRRREDECPEDSQKRPFIH